MHTRVHWRARGLPRWPDPGGGGGGGGTCSAVAEGFTAIPYWMFREILLNERLRRG